MNPRSSIGCDFVELPRYRENEAPLATDSRCFDEKHQSSPKTSALILAFQVSNTCGGNGEEQDQLNHIRGIWAKVEKESKALGQVGVPTYYVTKCVVRSVQKDGVRRAGTITSRPAPVDVKNDARNPLT